MTANHVELAERYVENRFGKNWRDILTVTDAMKDGFILTDFEPVGGFDVVKEQFENNISHGEMKKVDEIKPNVIVEWNAVKMMGDKNPQEVMKRILSGDASNAERLEAITAFSQSFMGGVGGSGSDLARANRLRAEIHEATTEYDKNTKQAELDKIMSRQQEQGLADAREKARETDIMDLAAKILVAGPGTVDAETYALLVPAND